MKDTVDLVNTVWVANECGVDEFFLCAETHDDGWGAQIAEVDGKDKAHRIVACLNACAGIPTEGLDGIDFGALLQLQKDTTNLRELRRDFFDRIRAAYRSMYSQQKHLDPDNTGQLGHGANALHTLGSALRMIGLRP